MDELAIILVRGLSTGAIFALIAMSFNVVYSSSGVLNFAQGNMLVLGGLAAHLLLDSSSVSSWFVMLPVAAVAIGLIMTVQGYVTLLPMRFQQHSESWLISTMAVSVIIGATMLLIQGPVARDVPSVFPGFRVFGTRTPAPYALAAGLALVWFVALRWFLRRTLTGLAISALSQDIDAARTAGLPVRRLQLLAFTISGLIIGSAGFVAAPVLTITGESGVKYVLNGFIASVVGGMGSNTGALLGGALLGVLTMMTTYHVGGEFQNLVALLLLVGVLMIRPEGIFGRSSARRV